MHTLTKRSRRAGRRAAKRHDAGRFAITRRPSPRKTGANPDRRKDLNFLELVGGQFPRERRGRFAEDQLSQSDLDGDLPASCHADELPVNWVFDRPLGGSAELLVVVQEPKECVGLV